MMLILYMWKLKWKFLLVFPRPQHKIIRSVAYFPKLPFRKMLSCRTISSSMAGKATEEYAYSIISGYIDILQSYNSISF